MRVPATLNATFTASSTNNGLNGLNLEQHTVVEAEVRTNSA